MSISLYSDASGKFDLPNMDKYEAKDYLLSPNQSETVSIYDSKIVIRVTSLRTRLNGPTYYTVHIDIHTAEESNFDRVSTFPYRWSVLKVNSTVDVQRGQITLDKSIIYKAVERVFGDTDQKLLKTIHSLRDTLFGRNIVKTIYNKVGDDYQVKSRRHILVNMFKAVLNHTTDLDQLRELMTYINMLAGQTSLFKIPYLKDLTLCDKTQFSKRNIQFNLTNLIQQPTLTVIMLQNDSSVDDTKVKVKVKDSQELVKDSQELVKDSQGLVKFLITHLKDNLTDVKSTNNTHTLLDHVWCAGNTTRDHLGLWIVEGDKTGSTATYTTISDLTILLQEKYTTSPPTVWLTTLYTVHALTLLNQRFNLCNNVKLAAEVGDQVVLKQAISKARDANAPEAVIVQAQSPNTTSIEDYYRIERYKLLHNVVNKDKSNNTYDTVVGDGIRRQPHTYSGIKDSEVEEMIAASTTLDNIETFDEDTILIHLNKLETIMGEGGDDGDDDGDDDDDGELGGGANKMKKRKEKKRHTKRLKKRHTKRLKKKTNKKRHKKRLNKKTNKKKKQNKKVNVNHTR
jgi:hypothetical protein